MSYVDTTSKLDEVAEWLRRWTANPLGSARVGSNPILVVSILLHSVAEETFFKENTTPIKKKTSIGQISEPENNAQRWA